MFTGIITDQGEIISVTPAGDTRFEIRTGYDTQSIALGASIACDGVCLTVIETGADYFAVEASQETLMVTTAKAWQAGRMLNLERAMRMGDEFGGHIVSGHVDGLAEILSIEADGDSRIFTFAAPLELRAFIAAKGSVTLNGTSLTVNKVEDTQFTVNIIPHTQAVTGWGTAQAGDWVNLEIDVLARYVARLKEVDKGEAHV